MCGSTTCFTLVPGTCSSPPTLPGNPFNYLLLLIPGAFFGTQTGTFGPYLVSVRRILIPVVVTTSHGDLIPSSF
jgi:hypothetical protein